MKPAPWFKFSTVASSRGGPDVARDPRGFAMKYYTEDGNWVKFHFKTDQGIKCFTSEEAAVVGGRDQFHCHKDLYDAIERGDFPSWTLKVQVMPEGDAANYRIDPFDLTKVWNHKDYPLIPIGKMVLNRTPDNYFAETEHAAFDPGHFVLGIGPSPDRMLQARLFGYGDAHRYRLGINHSHLPINSPKGVAGGAQNYGRDGAMPIGAPNGRVKNYEPKDAQQRLVDNIAGSLAQVSRDDIITRSVEHFRKADPEFGRRVAEGIAARRKVAVGSGVR